METEGKTNLTESRTDCLEQIKRPQKTQKDIKIKDLGSEIWSEM